MMMMTPPGYENEREQQRLRIGGEALIFVLLKTVRCVKSVDMLAISAECREGTSCFVCWEYYLEALRDWAEGEPDYNQLVLDARRDYNVIVLTYKRNN
jgi:hypothetical protein